MPNLELIKKTDVSSFRKIAIGTWQTAYDPSVYGTMEIRMDEAMKYIADFRKRTGKRLTVSHLMAKAMGAVFVEVPDANAVLRWNRVYQRKVIAAFFQVVMTDEGAGKTDLSGATVYDIDKKSVMEIYDDFQAKVDKVRARKDQALESTRKTFLSIPYLLLNMALKLIGFLSFGLNLDLRFAGIPNDPFGSVMITNVGSLGLDTAFAPLVPYSRVAMVLAVGVVKEVPIVDGGEIKIAKTMNVNATFDHRFIDGFHASVMSRVLRKWLENPYEHFDKINDLPEASAVVAAS